MSEYEPCSSEQCNRKVRHGVAYCCAGCADAWEAAPRYDADGYHSSGCDARATERGVYSWNTAEAWRSLKR